MLSWYFFLENVSFSAPSFLFIILDTLRGLLEGCTKWLQVPLLRLTQTWWTQQKLGHVSREYS